MKIAIASDGNYVSQHFGHCEGFVLYDVGEDKAWEKVFVDNPGHRPGYLPEFLSELKVNSIISGGMGEAAQRLFTQKNIEVVVGADGLCDDIIRQYLNGNLKSTNSVCKEHHYEGSCNE